MINVKNLKKQLKFMKTLKKHQFDFESIVSEFDENNCGTICCNVGWTPAVFPELVKWGGKIGLMDAITGEDLDICETGKLVFNLDVPLSCVLLAPVHQVYIIQHKHFYQICQKNPEFLELKDEMPSAVSLKDYLQYFDLFIKYCEESNKFLRYLQKWHDQKLIMNVTIDDIKTRLLEGENIKNIISLDNFDERKTNEKLDEALLFKVRNKECVVITRQQETGKLHTSFHENIHVARIMMSVYLREMENEI